MEWPREIASFLVILPTIQGTRLGSNVPLLTLNEVIERIQESLFPPNRHAPQMVLVFGLSAEVLRLLQLDNKPLLLIRDLDRFPVNRQILHPARVVHDFFVTPATPVTLRSPLAALTTLPSPSPFTVAICRACT